MSDYDVIVVGAGNGGLTSALSLAKNAFKVLLLERHNIPGGCATSFIRGRFEFEVALHQLSSMGSVNNPGPLRMLLAKLGVLDKIELVEGSTMYRIVLPDHIDVTLPAQRDATVEALKKRFPEEKNAIDRFFELVEKLCLEWVSVDVLNDPEASKSKYPLLFTYRFKDTQSVLDAYFKSPELKLALSIYWLYMGQPPSRMPFFDLALLLFTFLEFKPFHKMNYPAASYGVSKYHKGNKPFAASCGELTPKRD